MTATTHSIFSAFRRHFLVAATMKSTIFWVAFPSSLKEAWHFRGTDDIHLQGQHVSQAMNQ
jgi:hypothetical protein